MHTGFFLIDNLRYAIMIGGLLLLIIIETWAPAVNFVTHRWQHTARNLLIGAIYVGCGAIVGTAVAWVTARTSEAHLGLFNYIALPVWTQLVVGIVAIDFVEYWRHRFSHTVPFLWRFHRLHHSDPVMEASTTLRNHPLHIFEVLLPRTLPILLLGLSPFTLFVHASLTLSAQYFHHSNFRLPVTLDALIGLIIVTPGQHFVHHAREQKYTDSQYGIVFIFWDKLFGTLVPAPERRSLPLGLDEFAADSEQTIVAMLASPLDKETRLRFKPRFA